MKLELNIENISVISTKHGPDRIYINTIDLPMPYFPFDKDGKKLYLYFVAAANTGKDYCEKHFPNIPIKVLK